MLTGRGRRGLAAAALLTGRKQRIHRLGASEVPH
jgi:hypothetical protein